MAKKTSISNLPNNRTHAWIIWILSSFFMFYKFALEVSPSVMTTTLMKTFSIDGVQLGNLAACYFYAYLLLQIPAGLLLDKFGPRKITTVAIAICALGSILFSRAESLGMAGFARFLTGAGAAFAAVNCIKLTANWFSSKQFAFLAGLMMTCAMLGAVGGQAPLSELIKSMPWRDVMAGIGVIGLILSGVFWVIVRDKSPTHKLDHAIGSSKFSLFAGLKQILSKSQCWWLSVYSGFAFAPVMVFGGLWGVSFIGEAFQITHNIAAQAVSLIFIGFAVGAPVLGWFSDWIGKRRIVMFWGTLIALITISCVIYAPHLSYAMLNFLLFLFGFSISGFLLCFSMIRERCIPALAATAVGFMNAFDALFGAISDPLTGKILDLKWDGKIIDGARIYSEEAYKIAFLTLPIFLMISLISMIFIKETHCKPTEPTTLP